MFQSKLDSQISSNQEARQQSTAAIWGSKALAMLLAFSTPVATLGLSGCSENSNEASSSEVIKPNFSSVAGDKDSKISIKDIGGRVAVLGELHQGLQKGLISLISLADAYSNQQEQYFAKNPESILALKAEMQSLARLLLNSANNSGCKAIEPKLKEIVTALQEFTDTFSDSSKVSINWSSEAESIPGAEKALKLQDLLEQMTSAVNEDIGALLPGITLSKSIYLSQTLGSIRTTLTSIQELSRVTNVESDTSKLALYKAELVKNIENLKISQNDDDLKSITSGLPLLIDRLASLHTALSDGKSNEAITKVAAVAQTSLKELELVQKSIDKDIEKRDPQATTRSSGFFYPYYHHYFYTGHFSGYGGEHSYSSRLGAPSSKSGSFSKSSGFKAGSGAKFGGVKTGGFGRSGSGFSAAGKSFGGS